MLLKRSSGQPTQSDGHMPAQDSACEDPLVLLHHETTLFRLRAIRSLGERNDAAAKQALCERLAHETDNAVRDVLSVELARMGGEDIVEGLFPLLRSDDAALRNIVIDILKELPHEIAPRMETLLDDPDPDVRIFLVNVLEALRHPAVEDWLIAVISMDRNVNVVITALDLLNEVGTAAALPALKQTLQRFADEPFVIFSIESAIKRIEGNS